jgi:hypothetical protein
VVTRRRALLGGAVLAILAIVVVVVCTRRGDDAPAAAAPPPSAPVTDHASASPSGGVATRPDLAPRMERLQQALDDYRREAVYPPWSRPLDEGTAYKLRWNEPVVSDLLFDDRGALRVAFAADRAVVGFGEPYASWIEVWEGDDREHRVAAQIAQAWVMSSGAGRRVPLEYRDDGTRRYRNTFTPSEHEELATAQQVRISAEVVVGEERRVVTRDFTYTPRPVLEIVRVSDALRDGSVVVTLDVDVHEPGLHTIEANLVSPDGAVPIAYVDVSAPLAEGRGRVELVFFGRAVRGAQLDGPWLVRDLRGFRRDVDGGENLPWSDPRTHLTAAYRAADLSDAEWDAPEKREKIEALEALLQSQR